MNNSREKFSFNSNTGEFRSSDKLSSGSLDFQALDASLNGVYVYDLKLRKHVCANRRFARLTGYTLEDLNRFDESGFYELFHPEDRERVMEHTGLISDGGDMREIECRFQTKDGRWIWCLYRETVFARDPDGSVSRITGIFLDITDRKRVEEDLRERLARLSWGLERTGVGTWLNELPFGRLNWNETTKRLFFVSSDEEPTIELFWSRIHPDDREATRTAVEKAIGEGILYTIDHRAVNPDTGETRWIRSMGQATYGDDGTPIRFDGVNFDITERKNTEEALRRSEAIYRRIAEANLVGVGFGDSKGNVAYVNDEMLRMMGYTRRDYEEGRINWRECIAPEYRSELAETSEQLIREGKVHNYERAFLRPDGGKTPYLGSAATVAPGEDFHVSIALDLTTTRMAEEKLRHLNETLERQVAERTAVAEKRASQLRQLAMELSNAEERERKHIAQILHDDLQQYLAALRFQLQLHMPEKADDQRAQNPIRLVDESIRKCRTLSHELSPPVLHQNGLLAALDWLASDMRHKHGLKVRFAGRPEAEPESPSLARMLFRSVRELLFNAVKHSGVDSVIVEAENSEDRILIRVIDEGKGFDPAAAETEGGKMTGFGLFTIKERVVFMGGRFEVESAPGKGCRITLEVPKDVLRISGQPEGTKFEAVAKEIEAGARNEAEKIKILLADDHDVMRQGLANLLENEKDMEVIAHAADGREAVRLAKELNPDLVLMDVTMPAMDGAEATAKILKYRPHIRIIGLSMHDDPGTEEKMRKAGAAAYLYKASPVKKLVETIRKSFS